MSSVRSESGIMTCTSGEPEPDRRGDLAPAEERHRLVADHEPGERAHAEQFPLSGQQQGCPTVERGVEAAKGYRAADLDRDRADLEAREHLEPAPLQLLIGAAKSVTARGTKELGGVGEAERP